MFIDTININVDFSIVVPWTLTVALIIYLFKLPKR